MRVRIKNWSNFQHYKDRCPPWIKLHFRILQSRDWVMASDSERVLAVACMLIASQDHANDGSFDADPDYFQRVAYLKNKPCFKSLIKNGFLEVLSDASNCKQKQAIDTTETEEEEETEAAAKRDFFAEFWSAYPKKVGKPAAEKSFNRLNVTDELLAQMLFVIQTSKHSDGWQKQGGQFIPNPATWLNQRRWEDQITLEDSIPIWER